MGIRLLQVAALLSAGGASMRAERREARRQAEGSLTPRLRLTDSPPQAEQDTCSSLLADPPTHRPAQEPYFGSWTQIFLRDEKFAAAQLSNISSSSSSRKRRDREKRPDS
ncbi:unnamed protein product [Pleuronectes platessa]|uniref:Uncharacterized protein n=1 Tax=Pleuronectes platessa TaxID=8262 RepID=A0A9N7V4D4_PLEPL|nr:unnamed protein product [Pleuronectes platessa]